MDRFPLLTSYRGLMQAAAVLILLVGFLGSIGLAREVAPETYNRDTREYEKGFDFVTFVTGLVFAGAGALTLLIQAELIQLGLAVEDHLYEVRNILAAQDPGRANSSAPYKAPSTESSPVRSETRTTDMPSARTPTKKTSEPREPTSNHASKPRVETATENRLSCIVATERTMIVKNPNDSYSVFSVAVRDQLLYVIGRTQNQEWVRIEGDEPRWLRVNDVQINGKISSLPVMED